MGAETKIQWADHTWSPWVGCTKVSEGCRNCYAAERDHRWGGDHWGPGKPRQVTSPVYWKQPLKWNAEARERGVRESVFPSLCDPFDAEAPAGALDWLWALIRATPHLDWLLLTKRPDRAARLFPWASAAEAVGVESAGAGGAPWGNVWVIASVEDQAAADRRISELLRLRVAHRGLSCEPLLGPVDLTKYLFDVLPFLTKRNLKAATQKNPFVIDTTAIKERAAVASDGLHWIIVGGESGAGARPCALEWIESIRDQCRAAALPCFVKQLGACVVSEARTAPLDCFPARERLALRRSWKAPDGYVWAWRAGLKDSHGGDPAEWPEDLRVRELPEERR